MIRIFMTAAALGAAIISPAIAASGDAQSGAIEYRDLDLATADGVAELDARIERAARSICEVDHHTTGTRLVSTAKRKCVDGVRASAKQQIASVIDNARRGG